MALTLTTDELGVRWRPISDDEKPKVQLWISEAIADLRLRPGLSNLDDRVDHDADLMLTAKRIVASMVERGSGEGGAEPGVTSSMDVAGPYSRQRTYANPQGDMYVLDKELSLLRERTSPGVGTIFTPPAR